MILRKIPILLTMVFLASSVNGEESVTALSGFITGNIYNELSYAEQRSYIIGYFDGLLASPLLHKSNVESDDLEICIRDMNDKQLLAIVEKYMNDNPDKWHMPMNLLTWSIIDETCGL